MAAPAMTDLSFCCTVSHGRDARATFLFYAGARFAHPRLISFRPAGAKSVTVFMKRDSHFFQLHPFLNSWILGFLDSWFLSVYATIQPRV